MAVDRPSTFIILCCSLCMSLVSQLTLVEGLYIIQAQLHGYDNPTQRCFLGCDNCDRCFIGYCDGNINGECTSGFRRCDTLFFLCLRPLSSQIGCDPDTDGVMRSNAENDNDTNFDFSQSTFLGLNNPLIFQGLTNAWNVSHDVVSNSSKYSVCWSHVFIQLS